MNSDMEKVVVKDKMLTSLLYLTGIIAIVTIIVFLAVWVQNNNREEAKANVGKKVIEVKVDQ